MKLPRKNAQTAIEYLVLLSLVAVIVMVSFSHLLPRANQAVSSLFFRAGSSIMGENVRPIDGNWCDWGPCQCVEEMGTRKRLCDCPAPLGSGAVCPGAGTQNCGCGFSSGGVDGGDSGSAEDAGDGEGPTTGGEGTPGPSGDASGPF